MEQQELNWPAADRLAILRDAELPEVVLTPETIHKEAPGRESVSGRVLRDVLNAIDYHQRENDHAWPYLSTIASRTGRSVSTTRRAIRALKSLGLLTVESRGRGRASAYTIKWLALWERVPSASRRPLKTIHGGACNIHGGASKLHDGCCSSKRGFNFDTEPPPPPTPSDDDAPAVAERLRFAGVDLAADTVRQAQAHGVTIAQMHAAIDHYASRRDAWGPGALRVRLIAADARTWSAAEGWPPPSDAEKKRQQREHENKRREEEQRERAEDERRKQRERDRVHQLELQWGQQLNAMPREQQFDLLEFPQDRRALVQHGPRAPCIRPVLLRALAARYGRLEQ